MQCSYLTRRCILLQIVFALVYYAMKLPYKTLCTIADFFVLVYYAMKLPHKTLCFIADYFCIGVLCNEVTLQDVVVLLQIVFVLVY